MARQLEKIGEEAPLVVLIDTWLAGANRKLRSREPLSNHWKNTKEQGVAYLTGKVRNKCLGWGL